MLEHIYPAFKRGRVMKRELLLALRDYTYTELFVRYKSYQDGIITGCHLTADKDEVVISPGLIKCDGFVFIISSAQRVVYEHTEKFASIKFKVCKKEDFDDYTRYETEFLLDENLLLKEGEIEICRFKLREGSVLRDNYKDFMDMETEYDTLNLSRATWCSRQGETLAKDIVEAYAREVLNQENVDHMDIQFAYLCMLNDEAVPRNLICDYVTRKLPGYITDQASNIQLYEGLCTILQNIGSNRTVGSLDRWEPAEMIIVD